MMKCSLVLALAGLSVATPAIINTSKDSGEANIVLATLGNPGVYPDMEYRRAEPAEGDPTELDEFKNLQSYSRLARDEETPSPYTQAFENQNATAIHQPILTERLDAYSADACANFCNSNAACEAFTIFVERQPSCTDCSNPKSNAAFMCRLYNTALELDIVTDEGRAQELDGKTFTRAIRAANGYNKIHPTTSTATKTAASLGAISRRVSAAVSTITVSTTPAAETLTTTVSTTTAEGTLTTATLEFPPVGTLTTTMTVVAPRDTVTSTLTIAAPRETRTLVSVETVSVIVAGAEAATVTTTATESGLATTETMMATTTATVLTDVQMLTTFMLTETDATIATRTTTVYGESPAYTGPEQWWRA